MKYLSVCSGIEAASVAWEPLGWEPVGFAEIDPFACAVLKHRFPGVKNFGDFTQIGPELQNYVDVLVGGTPCQDFSIAGLRAGLAGARGNLTIEFARLAARLRPEWIVWENVPGILSSDGGGAFGTFLGALAEIGYGFAYRVFDAQYFGVPQRRRRVFLVGHLGDWRRAAKVLFEPESLRGDSPPSRQARQIAPTIPARRTAGGGLGTDFDCDGGLIAFTCKDYGADAATIAPTLRAMEHDKSTSNGGGNLSATTGAGVRRLTPRECERLMGLPDDWTLVPYKGKLASDTSRYRAIGNSMAVPCMAYIGTRLNALQQSLVLR